MKYREIIDNIRERFTLRVSSRTVITEREVVQSKMDVVSYVQSEMMMKLAEGLEQMTRKSRVDDPKHGLTVLENDIIVLLDPTGFFLQLDYELENAYRRGLNDGENKKAVEQVLDQANEVRT